MNENDLLHEKLRAWKTEPAIPRSFHADVWARIRAREAQKADTGLAAFLRWLFPSPTTWQLAAVTALVMVALGASLGNMRASVSDQEQRTELAQRYAQSIDPYLKLAEHQQ